MWRALGTKSLTWRRFGVLVAQLPPESATATAERGRPAYGYADAVLARIEDLLRWQNWAGYQDHKRVSVPSPMPRPWSEQQTADRLDPAAIRARLAEQRKRKG